MTRDVTHAHSTPVTVQATTSQPPNGDDRPPGGIETMARTFVDALPYEQGDPRRLLGELLVRLARRIDEDGAVPASVAQFRMMLPQLVEVPNQAAGVVDELRLRRAQRILDGFLAQVQ